MYQPTSGQYDAPRHRLKNPFTMSKICGQIPLTGPKTGTVSLHLWSSSFVSAPHAAKTAGTFETGGAYRDRTDDPLLAKQVLSQLS